MMFYWLLDSWDKFCIWVTNQPMFVEVALGIGLFYVVLQIVRALSKLPALLLSDLFAFATKIKKKRKMPSRPRVAKPRPTESNATKPMTIDEDAPPLVFR